MANSIDLDDMEECVLNPQIFVKKKKYIWFGRDEAFRKDILSIFKLFLFYEIYVDGFVSDSSNDIGLKIFNKEIMDIAELDENEAIVVTNTEIQYSVCQPVKVCIKKKDTKSNVKYKYYDNVEGYQLKAGTYLRIYRITEMERLLCGKPVFVYGTDDEATRFAKYVRLLDFNFKGFYDDFENIRKEKIEDIDGYPVNCIEDFLYEDEGFVIISGCHTGQSIRKMGELGCQYLKKFVLAEPFAMHYLFVRQSALDLNLGNSYTGISKYPGLKLPERTILPEYPGFCIYGDHRDDNYKIVVLGGSTTDGNLFDFKPWPELLFERIDSKDVTIWNGGVAGYTSCHELIKFIRDVLPIKPDMVIIFDGYNDTCQGNRSHPYSFTYVREIFDYGAKHIADAYVTQQINGGICEGVSVEKTRFDNWIDNMALLHDIAILRNIKFYSFLQPMLMSKTRHKREEEIYMSSRQFYEEELYRLESFRDELQKSKTEKDYEFIYDLSPVFDDVHDVYMDICHVCEKGNKIIADAIYDVIRDQISR